MIRFSKFIVFYFILSGLVLVPGLISLVRFGLLPSIDFTGGTILEFRVNAKTSESKIQTLVKDSKMPLVSMQTTGANTYLLHLKPGSDQEITGFKNSLTAASASAEVVRVESVGPILGKELLSKAVVAALVAIIAILCYVAYAFKNIKFGVSAIVALIHDLLVVLGVFSILGVTKHVEVDTLFVTAFLTTMSFSVHDTIVVFDRIREFQKKGTRGSFDELADRALTETIGRSFTNSITIVFMLLALVLLGGETMRWFVVALLVGTISGTYSSDFVATPILILWDRWEKRKKNKK
jgi:preprotein translocase subunit SecF